MNSSSFLCGVLIGATAAVYIAKKRSGSSADNYESLVKWTGLSNQQNNQSKSNNTQSSSSNGSATSSGSSDQSGQSKASNLKLLTDFIKGNPDVRKEVDLILKETNTVIPGL